MLPRADITGTRPVVYIEAPLAVVSGTDARYDDSRLLNRIAIGQQLQANVLSRLEDGKFLVRIADTAARMALPLGTLVGDTLPMTLIDTEPRLTFLLGSDTGSKPGAASATLSSTGRLIDHLLQSAQQGGASTTIIGKTPVLTAPTGAAAQIATALHDTLSQSGLFYESHLNDWLNGSRSVKDLLLEPQNRSDAHGRSQTSAANSDNARLLGFVQELESGRSLTDLIRESQMKAGADNVSMRLLNSIREWTDSGRSLADLMQTLQAPGADALPMNPESARIINLQLDALERQRFMWQGQLWPGQSMQWEVSRDAPDGAAEDAEQSWQSVVRFELPSLGAVAASIKLAGDRVYVQVRTASDASATALRAHGHALAAALDAAGSPLDMLTVKRDADL